MLAYLALDFHRVRHRLRYPPGISLLYVSTDAPSEDTDKLFTQLEFLYPTQKSAKHVFKVAPNTSSSPRLGWKLQWRRLYTLFKGGLFMRYYHVAEDEEIPRITRTLTKYLYPSRAFFCVENSRGQSWLGHVKSGFTMQFDATDEATPGRDRIIQFITTILERRTAAEDEQLAALGFFDVSRNEWFRHKAPAPKPRFCNSKGKSVQPGAPGSLEAAES